MKSISVLLYFAFLSTSIVFGNTKENYIDTWRSLAIQHMLKHKIPASITMAQGILESGYGESNLAKTSNNHFGIKCGSAWNGDKSYRDDDSKNECFRKYSKADESFEDHASFLTTKERYAKLFALQIEDYQGWAHGLKEAGYATHPKYAQKLIDIIELHNLQDLDQNMAGADIAAIDLDVKEAKTDKKSIKKTETKSKSLTKSKSIEFESSLLANKHEVKKNVSKVKFVVVKKGDTFFRIAEEFKMGMWQLYKYNDFSEKQDMLEVGDIVYLQPKKRKAKRKSKAEFVVVKSIDLQSISQIEGIRLESLLRMNPEITDTELLLKKGSKIALR